MYQKLLLNKKSFHLMKSQKPKLNNEWPLTTIYNILKYFFSPYQTTSSSKRRDNNQQFLKMTSNLFSKKNKKTFEKFHEYLLRCEEKGFPRAGKNLLFFVEVIKFKVTTFFFTCQIEQLHLNILHFSKALPYLYLSMWWNLSTPASSDTVLNIGCGDGSRMQVIQIIVSSAL